MSFESSLTFRTPPATVNRVTDPSPEPTPRPKSATQRWISRLAFSFLIIAALLIWQAFHVHRAPSQIPPNVRMILYLIGAFASTVLAVLGFRERHKPEWIEEEDRT